MRTWGFLAGWITQTDTLGTQRRPGQLEITLWAFVGLCVAISLILMCPPVFGPMIGASLVLSLLGALSHWRGAMPSRPT